MSFLERKIALNFLRRHAHTCLRFTVKTKETLKITTDKNTGEVKSKCAGKFMGVQ
jgi:hypothetical protein